MHYIKYYFCTLLSMVILDYLWLGYIMKNWYAFHFGSLMRTEIQYNYAILFYVVYACGIVYFCIIPNINQPNILPVVMSAFMFGLMCYTTYDLTNAATITNFPTAIIIPDILWGSFVTALSASVGFYLGKIL